MMHSTGFKFFIVFDKLGHKYHMDYLENITLSFKYEPQEFHFNKKTVLVTFYCKASIDPKRVHLSLVSGAYTQLCLHIQYFRTYIST